jgi:glutamate receptor-interacting protein
MVLSTLNNFICRCGRLQPGDRILIINQTRCDCLSGAEATLLLAQSKPLLKLHVQFDVAEAVVPSSGVFMVKLARRGNSDLGIFVTCKYFLSKDFI